MSFNKYPYTDFHEMNDDWVILKVKELIAAWAETKEDWEQIQSDWVEEQQAFLDLKAFCENYFDELDVQTEINNKLDAMAEDGSLLELIKPYIDTSLPDEVATWLSAHVNPDTGYVIDNTLSISEAAADAKVTGTHIFRIENDNLKIVGDIPFEWEMGAMYSATGIEYGSSSRIRTLFTKVNPGDVISVYNMTGASTGIYQFASNETTESGVNERLAVNYVNGTYGTVTIGASANYIRIQNESNNVAAGNGIIVVVKSDNNIIYDIIGQKYDPQIVGINHVVDAALDAYVMEGHVNASSTSSVVMIPLKTYANGNLKFSITDEENFPEGITFNGYQIRDDQNNIIITTKSKSFKVASVASEYLTIGTYFATAIGAKYTYNLNITFESEAMNSILGNAVPIGEHSDKYEGFGNFNIYGLNKAMTILKDTEGDYSAPPIEISGGTVSGLTIIQAGGHTEHTAYCIHTDNDNNTDNTLLVSDCYLESNSNACVGLGTRNNYDITFRDCTFKAIDNGTDTARCFFMHNSNNGEATSADDASHVTFINCTFISESATCMILQDYHGSVIDYCDFTFINCTFSPASGDIDDCVAIQYKSYDPEELDSHEFKNHFSLNANSCGNNVTWLNADHT